MQRAIFRGWLASQIRIHAMHISPELVISCLRFLLEGYKIARDKFRDTKTPERVEEILVQAEKTPENVDPAEIERRLNDALEPNDAAIVKGDLELLSLILFPVPKMDAFDYWGQLTKLVAGLQAYAIKNRLFELRGRHDPRFGEVLLLASSGQHILPDEHAVQLAVAVGARQQVKDATATALLAKDEKGFPITAVVMADFNEYHSMGGPPSVLSYGSYFSITSGQQQHWLRFDQLRVSYQFKENYEYMLDASDLISIVKALKDDIQQIAASVRADEEKTAPLFSAIDAFATKMSQ
jgi:hypothetical protein